MLFAKTVFWFGRRRNKKDGETEKKKSGIVLKDSCSKKVSIAVKCPLQGFCDMVAHKMSCVAIFFPQFIKPVLW